MNQYVKWLLIVGLNSIVGFFWGYGAGDGAGHVIGMIAGVLTWYLAYLSLDRYLLKTGRLHSSRKLVLSTSLSIPIQFTIYPNMLAGIAAFGTCETIGMSTGTSSFPLSYSLTLFTGLYLGVICLVMYGLVSAVIYVRNSRVLQADRA